MKSTAVKFAVYALLFTLVWTLLEHVMGYNTTNHEVGQYTRMVPGWLFYILVIVAIYQVRRQQGSLSFAQGLKAGSLMSAIYAIGVLVIYGVYGEVINTQYKPTLMQFERAQLVAHNASAQEIDARMKMIDMTTGGSVVSYVFLVLFMFLGGFVFSVIASLILQKKQKKAA